MNLESLFEQVQKILFFIIVKERLHFHNFYNTLNKYMQNKNFLLSAFLAGVFLEDNRPSL
jgi:hypothetical protein